MICSADILNLKSDILDKIGQKIIITVEVDVLEGDSYSPLIPPAPEVTKKRVRV